MITALCANPCVDRTVAIERFAYGGMNRILEERLDGSGKGVNVALASVQLGMEAACVGLLAEERGALIEDRLVAGRCQAEFVPVPGAVRVNMKVLDRSTGTITEINEAGAPVPPEAVDAMLPFLSERFANPSGSHRFARTIRQVIDESRDVVADVVGCEPGEMLAQSLLAPAASATTGTGIVGLLV